MISDIFKYDELRILENFCLKKYKNAVYKGQVDLNTKKREGFGVLLSEGNRVYEGQQSIQIDFIKLLAKKLKKLVFQPLE